MRWEESIFTAFTKIPRMFSYQSTSLMPVDLLGTEDLLLPCHCEEQGMLVQISSAVSVKRVLYQSLRGKGAS